MNYQEIKNADVDELAMFIADITSCSRCPAKGICSDCGKCLENIERWLKDD